MYVMDIYSVKQPQIIIIKVKMKEDKNWEKRILEKSWMKFILLPLFFCDCETVTCSVLFTSGKAVQLTWYEFSTYLHQLQPPSLV